jgi:hypothetical protein
MKKIYYEKCHGGYPYKEIDGNIYCLGHNDLGNEFERQYRHECVSCPKYLKNNLGNIKEYVERSKMISDNNNV